MSDSVGKLLASHPSNAFVCNTDVSTGNGIHWLAMLPLKDTLYIFDSLGPDNYRPNDKIMLSQIEKAGYRPAFYDGMYQYANNSMCGFFAIYVAQQLNKHIKQLNEENIFSFVSRIFGTSPDDGDIKKLISVFGKTQSGTLDHVLNEVE